MNVQELLVFDSIFRICDIMVTKLGFIKIQYFNKYSLVSVETFRIFYGSSGLYVRRVSGKKVYHLHENNIPGFWDLKSEKSTVFPLIPVKMIVSLSKY